MLKDKKILLAVCGSVSFYKAYEILSRLKKLGADVRVMLSDGALKFTNPLSFEALTNHPILCTGNENWQNKVSHIEYAKADLVLIAPASANTINCLANGVATSVFMQTLLATDAKILIAPAANNKMLENFATQRSFEILRQNGVKIIEPLTKILACGDLGRGALAHIDTIIYEVKRALCEAKFQGKKVVITGGATSERIDNVRAISNFSSGKMAKALADAFYFLGANVSLISSVVYENLPYKTSKFTSTKELLSLCKNECENADLLVMSAAVSDYVSDKIFSGKLKKSELGDEWSLKLVKNLDILSELKGFKCQKIGFKLETNTQNAEQNAKDMLKNKELNAVCLNILGNQNGFGSDKNEVKFITQNDSVDLGLDDKSNIALKIANLASNL
ncbi:phosphopantothenate synthase [Campylobacter mucosalis]|uniref:bifunctional phosphopantothenoylcysteine decarboxylase/phosphopantothenate--cysteine ligase CoaBC n=1 Tax=Campylobacter mucosalis TaxID=202 RepID=UPI0004D6EAB7|nr:bifunctional phosphopantothenoylcysteine decarboxylase/phosphopantothenate--cysteine ligase CoaBC [Campylobacter mucosalis]KEA46588.1 phosphopantothenate synthase [Campylobacter mucosalis]